MEEDTQRFHGLERAIITGVVREGPDVVVRFRNARLQRGSPWNLRFIATMRFVDARRINSEDCQNARYPARLEPGWKVHMVTFDGLSADLSVFHTFMNMMGFVSHRIWCDAVKLRLRFDPLGSLKGYYFPASFYSVSGEPAPSSPIEGQEGPIGYSSPNEGQEGVISY